MKYSKLNCKKKTNSKFFAGRGFLHNVASMVAFMLRVMIKVLHIVN